MDQNIKQQTIDNLAKAQSVLIAVAPNTGFSGLASGLALLLSFEKLGKTVTVSANNPTVEDAQKLYGVDKIGQAKGGSNLAIIVSNAVETVDRVSHYLDGDQLKLILHAFPGSEGPKKEDISFSQEMIEPDIVFALGYESEEAIKQFVTQEHNISPNGWLVNVNTKDLGQIFAQANIFDQTSSGLSEVTAQVVSDLALPVDEDIAFNLYQGISQDTNQFNPASIGNNTFNIASWLIKFGAGHASFAQGSTSAIKPKPQPIQQQVSMQPTIEQNVQSTQQPQKASEIVETPMPQVEREKTPSDSGDDWLQPPKIYKGSKSFDSKG